MEYGENERVVNDWTVSSNLWQNKESVFIRVLRLTLNTDEQVELNIWDLYDCFYSIFGISESLVFTY